MSKPAAGFLRDLNDELMAGTEDERTTYRIKAGVPGPLVEAAIVDTDGNFLPADGETQGELVLRAPSLTEGYFNEPQKAAPSSGPVARCAPVTWQRWTAWA